MIRNLVLTLLAAVLPPALFANSTGAPIFATGVPVDPITTTCVRCHRPLDNNPPGGFIRVETFNYRPGQTQTVKVTVYHPEAARWGFELTARRVADLTQRAGNFVLKPEIRVRCSDDPNGRDVTAESACPPAEQEFATHTAPLTLTGSNGMKTFEIDWQAPSADVGDVVFFASGNAANSSGNNQGDRIYNNAESPFRIEAEGRVCPNTARPVLRDVVNAASFQTPVAMNTLISIRGSNFVAQGTTKTASTADFRTGTFPKELACVAVELNGDRNSVPITYVQADQINAQLPLSVPSGPVRYRVIINPGRSNELVSDTGMLTITNLAPSLFTFNSNGKNVAAVHPDGVYATDPAVVQGARAIRPGDIVQLYATGLGRTDPDWQAGEFPNRTSALRERVTVTIGGTTLAPADVLYAGSVPGSISGLYQINVRVPASQSEGDVPVTLGVGGQTSAANTVITVRR